ncbi:liver-expressed antimicrobial peptide 2-like [Mugil cephalus]|uniref:liver-expressed antimicrobial peptide 2-like n=1 Tax=Mugil cephalus TaxID=48193 RepID=UPI001FB75FD9|nr:liver-expressed antimicrobial peptide 2-like [Mugil cephalus]
MKTLKEKIIVLSVVLSLICFTQVNSMPLPKELNGLVQRTKRSLVWRWNIMKPVGTSCRGHAECGTNYCRKYVCSFWYST